MLPSHHFRTALTCLPGWPLSLVSFSDGTINWDEFSTYMLLESQGSARVREFESTVTMQVGWGREAGAPGGPPPQCSFHLKYYWRLEASVGSGAPSQSAV